MIYEKTNKFKSSLTNKKALTLTLDLFSNNLVMLVICDE